MANGISNRVYAAYEYGKSATIEAVNKVAIKVGKLEVPAGVRRVAETVSRTYNSVTTTCSKAWFSVDYGVNNFFGNTYCNPTEYDCDWVTLDPEDAQEDDLGDLDDDWVSIQNGSAVISHEKPAANSFDRNRRKVTALRERG